MKKFLAYFFLFLFVTVGVGLIWWQYNKKSIVKNTIENSITNATNDAYTISYDSSYIDELGGNASFYNIVLQQDSMKKNEKAKVKIKVQVQKFEISGIDIKAYLNDKKIIANTLNIISPIIDINIAESKTKIVLTKADTMALYKKIIGNFKSISAKEINIINGKIVVNKWNQNVKIADINIKLNSFLVDSSKDYNNIISYFINDVTASIKNISILNKQKKSNLTFSNIEYNAVNKFFKIDTIAQLNSDNGKLIFQLKNNIVSGISTAAFILDKQIKADAITSSGGKIAIYAKKSKPEKVSEIDIENDIFEEATIRKIILGSTDITFFDADDAQIPALVFNQINFNANNIATVKAGNDLLLFLTKVNWVVTGSGTSTFTKDNKYKLDIGRFVIDNTRKVINISKISVKPTLSENAFSKQLTMQKDRYDMLFENINVKNFNLAALLNNKSIIADEVVLKPTILIYNDKTVAEDMATKIGKYPHQMLQKMVTKLAINKIVLQNGYVSYKEKAAESKQVGNVFFNNINGTISNVTNIKQAIATADFMKLNVSCNFLNAAQLHTTWLLPLFSPTANFKVEAEVQKFDAKKLNLITIPLGLAKIETGTINKYNFSISGSDYKATGKGTLLYDSLKITLLKKIDGQTQLKDKKGLSKIANSFIKNSNPTNNNLREGNCAVERVMNKSFFNLVWKSVYAGAKSSTN